MKAMQFFALLLKSHIMGMLFNHRTDWMLLRHTNTSMYVDGMNEQLILFIPFDTYVSLDRGRHGSHSLIAYEKDLLPE